MKIISMRMKKRCSDDAYFIWSLPEGKWGSICPGQLKKWFVVPEEAKFIWVELTPIKDKEPRESWALTLSECLDTTNLSDKIKIQNTRITICSYPRHYFKKKVKAGKYYLRILWSETGEPKW